MAGSTNSMQLTPKKKTPKYNLGNLPPEYPVYDDSTAPGGSNPIPAPTAPAFDPNAWQDSTYNNSLGDIQTGLNNLQGYLTGQGKSLASSLGVNYSGDLTNPSSLSFSIDPNVDVSNPFSKAALLKRSFQQTQRGNTNSYAARGQLYSGALQNAQNDAAFNNLQGQDSLLKAAGSGFGDLYKQWLDANTNATSQRSGAASDAYNRFITLLGQGY